MKLFCGLPNETASTVVGILHIVFGTILCAAYSTAVRVVWDGKIQGDQILTRPLVEQDFVSSLGVRETSGTFAKTFVVAFLSLSAIKILQGGFLLFAIFKSSSILLRTWLAFEICTFVARIAVFVLLFTLGNCKPAMILVHSLTFAVEFYCVVLVTIYIHEIMDNDLRELNKKQVAKYVFLLSFLPIIF